MVNLIKIFYNKIYIPFEDFQAIGGPSTFMANLRTYFERVGFPYAKNPYLSKGIFFPVVYNSRIIKWVKVIGGKIIQRLDGVYYPSQHGVGYEIMNKEIKTIYRHYADVVIFQSEYSKRQCFSMLGEKKEGEFVIIYNGANTEIFFPSMGMTAITGKIRFVMTGSFRKKAMIEPVVRALDALKGKYDFDLAIIGPVINTEIEHFFQRDYITMLGSKTSTEVANILRKSHIFIHSQLNDNCPNAVLEAISCGLPVVGFDSGSMGELLSFQKDLLAFVSQDLFQKYEDFHFEKLQEKIVLAVDNFPTHKKIALDNHKAYSFDECGKKYYVELMKI